MTLKDSIFSINFPSFHRERLFRLPIHSARRAAAWRMTMINDSVVLLEFSVADFFLLPSSKRISFGLSRLLFFASFVGFKSVEERRKRRRKAIHTISGFLSYLSAHTTSLFHVVRSNFNMCCSHPQYRPFNKVFLPSSLDMQRTLFARFDRWWMCLLCVFCMSHQ